MHQDTHSSEGGVGLRLDIPGHGSLTLSHLVMDLNGTLAVDGRPLACVAERLMALRHHFQVNVLTAGTHGNVDECAIVLGARPRRVTTGLEKRDYIRALDAARVVVMGNGANDVLMLEEAALGIAVLGAEGLCAEVIRVADVVVTDPCTGLDLLLHPARLIATLRR